MIQDKPKSTVHGLCPGCEAWQLEVPNAIAVRDAWIVELIIREHAAECPGLAAIAKDKGVDP